MNKLEDKILATIKKNNLIEKGDKIVIGVSGGPDSMCLLKALINIFNESCQNHPSPMATFYSLIKTAFILLTPDELDSSFFILNLPNSFVLFT